MTESALRSSKRPGVDRIAFLLWIAAVIVGLWTHWSAIPALGFVDADDYLRIVQVRDLLAGQNWFDVTQYRINPMDGGGLMHWSRFVDMQIAALVLLFRPFLTPQAAEYWALAIYPLLLILPLLLLFGRILSMLGDRKQVIVGLLLAATGVTFLHYFAPLRIDHHNWQLVLSVAMLWLALGEPSFRKGLGAALVISAHLEISLEGFPYLVIFGALFAIEWLRQPAAAPRLAGFAVGLAFIPAIWVLIFRGWSYLSGAYCDAFSQPYIAGAAATGLVVFFCLRVRWLGANHLRRFGVLALAGAVGAGAFLIFGQSCLNGPFGQLEPLVRTFWYERVMEGQPVWLQMLDIAALFVAPTLVGLVAAIWAWQRARGSETADNWTRLLFVLFGSTLLSMLVFRTTAVTQAYMVPPFAAMAVALWQWGRARKTAIGRIGGSLIALMAVPSVDSILGSLAVRAIAPAKEVSIPVKIAGGRACPSAAMLDKIARKPAALLFAPVDIGPTILARTPHSVMATGHHRNHAAMNGVIKAFLSNPEVSRPIVEHSGATWLVLCPGLPEMTNIANVRPTSLAARLIQGDRFDWLVYDASLSSPEFRVYRIQR